LFGAPCDTGYMAIIMIGTKDATSEERILKLGG
jgi:hypothetical protein